jgi:hypothetical protein
VRVPKLILLNLQFLIFQCVDILMISQTLEMQLLFQDKCEEPLNTIKLYEVVASAVLALKL